MAAAAAAAELSSNREKLNTEPVYCICVDLWDPLRLAGSHVVKMRWLKEPNNKKKNRKDRDL